MTTSIQTAASRPRRAERILVLDGAMGTMIQELKLDEAGYRGARFDAWNREVRGNNDLLEPHPARRRCATFTSPISAPAPTSSRPTRSPRPRSRRPITACRSIAYELNLEGARLVRAAAITARERGRPPRFVAGAIGPTNRTASISPDVNDPGFRAITFDAAARRLCRAGARPDRRRRRPAADRDHLRHAQRQGRDLRDRRRVRGARRRACRS